MSITTKKNIFVMQRLITLSVSLVLTFGNQRFDRTRARTSKKPSFFRYQPQVILFTGGPPGQQFLLQPGAPPGNFLVPQQPQPGPGLVYRTVPQRPVYVAGYPKPAHIPPIEKDAEEVPNLAGNHPTRSGGNFVSTKKHVVF